MVSNFFCNKPCDEMRDVRDFPTCILFQYKAEELKNSKNSKTISRPFSFSFADKDWENMSEHEASEDW